MCTGKESVDRSDLGASADFAISLARGKLDHLSFKLFYDN